MSNSFHNHFKFLFIIVVSLIISGCANNNQSNSSNDMSAVDERSDFDDWPTSWEYDQLVDDLTGNVSSVIAMLMSTNKVDYNMYNKDDYVQAAIMLNYDGRMLGPGIKLWNNKRDGLRLSEYNGSGFLAVFDDGEVDDTWSLVQMDDERQTLCILDQRKARDFVEKLKKSKTCRIQLNFEKVGKKTFDFKTEGLKWDF